MSQIFLSQTRLIQIVLNIINLIILKITMEFLQTLKRL